MFVSYRRYTPDEYARAMRLFAAGYGSFKVAEVTGFPRATVRNWQRLGHPPARLQTPDYTDWRPPANTEASYC